MRLFSRLIIGSAIIFTASWGVPTLNAQDMQAGALYKESGVRARPAKDAYQSLLAGATQDKGYLGGVTLVAQKGQVLHLQSFGYRDLMRQDPMSSDAIFRIYSMTKSVAAVAALVLVDDGKLNLDAPVSGYLPEFLSMQVMVGGSADRPQLRPAQRPITARQLLTHTAGFATGGIGMEEASKLLGRQELHRSTDLRDFAGRAARSPLQAEPGTRFLYDGVNYQVLGRLIEVVSGLPLDVFMQERIFTPLKMSDTGFSVSAAKRARIVDITTMGPAGHLVLAAGPSAANPGAMLNPYVSAAGGMYSTASDFLRFCQMLLQGGQLDGVVVLSAKSVQTMLSNQLVQSNPDRGLQPTESGQGEGHGLGGWVLLEGHPQRRSGSVGSFGWSGAASTYFMIDPKQQLVAILLLQHLPGDASNELPKLQFPFYQRVYQTLSP